MKKLLLLITLTLSFNIMANDRFLDMGHLDQQKTYEDLSKKKRAKLKRKDFSKKRERLKKMKHRLEKRRKNPKFNKKQYANKFKKIRNRVKYRRANR